MSLLVTLLADALVAILLVATIASSVRLSRRIAKLKGDEAALRQTIGDLVVATTTAERAIAGLRATLDECDRTLGERLGTAERYAADLSGHIAAGEAVIARIAAIVSHAQPGRPVAAPIVKAPEPVAAPRPVPVREPAPESAPPSNGERLGAAAAAARAMSERALGRLRSRAA
jgi:hypothetical protein